MRLEQEHQLGAGQWLVIHHNGGDRRHGAGAGFGFCRFLHAL
jgi:hypothetical protein